MKRIFAAFLAVICAFSMGGCRQNTTAPTQDNGYTDPFSQYADDYDALSGAVYDAVLGEFYAAYMQAKQAPDLSTRWAYMAIAEAKLLGAGVMLPLTSHGGNYAISRVVPNSATSTLWGSDDDRFSALLVATTPITAAHRAQLKALWAKHRGSGTYRAAALAFLQENGYTLKDTYAISYTSDPKTWDALATARAADGRAIVNTYDGLVVYDDENNLRGALASSWEVSDDGLSYTFHLRENVQWVDAQGRAIDTVRADDFVAGMQHLLDAAQGPESLVQGVIKGASAYTSGEDPDFSHVGVTALDEYTLRYTLEAPVPYFLTMLSYSAFAPLCRSYYTARGGQFGSGYDALSPTYTYGKSPETIAYCGAYLVANATAENTIVFKANPGYYNAQNVTLKTVTWLYNDGSEALKGYTDTISGITDTVSLNAPAAQKAKADGNFEKYAYVSATDATSFMAFLNVHRTATANFNDAGAAVSGKGKSQLVRTNAAMKNVHFRRAVCFSLDRAAYNAQSVGEELKYASLINSYTPGIFVSLVSPVTVTIGGEAVTYEAGTPYGKILQDQLTADGVSVQVWDEKADGGVGTSSGFDGWFSPENARKELALAVSQLAADGLPISENDPIHLEMPYFAGSEPYTNRANALKQSVEAALGGAVVVELIPCSTSDIWYDAGYQANFGYESNYDLYDVAGWGPDYGDPQTYLDTFLPDYAGYVLKRIGIF